MKNFLSKQKKAKILAAVLAGSCFSFSNSAAAMEEVNIDWDGKKLFRIQYYGIDDEDSAVDFFESLDDEIDWLKWNLSSDLKSGLNKAFNWWAEIIGPGANITNPAQVFVGSNDVQNAFATDISYLYGEENNNPNLYHEIFKNAQNVAQFANVGEIPYTQNDDGNLDTDLENIGYSIIGIGQNLGVNEDDGNFGWTATDYYALPLAQSLKNLDITPVMFHEIGHSLGISAVTEGTTAEFEDTTFKLGMIENGFSKNSFTAHLYNQDGENFPNGDTLILTSPDYLSVAKSFLESYGDEITDDVNIFYVTDATTGANGKTALYFVGDNVTEVLDGKTFTRLDGVQISGIPINGWEDGPEFSHLELARSMMSHQNYRSYNNFMEAELAVLQDIGYDIDRKNFYGRSIYNDGLTLTNTQGFSARENNEYVDGYNTSTLGVGLHVYGSNNDVTQAANIYTSGYGAVGIRVDGLNDKITIPAGTEIHADGEYGTGVLVAYGRNHEINIDGTVTATGLFGDALHFEFGANSLGGTTEYRGSYFRYFRMLDSNGEIFMANNSDLLDDAEYAEYSFTDLENGDLNAPMVDNVNISGKLEVNSTILNNAIYIAEESFVKNININEGAEITGNITSNWKNFDSEEYGISSEPQYFEDTTYEITEPLKIQYNGGEYVYNEYIPDLVTNLNFNADNTYSDNITGADNIKLNVTAGTFNYSGTADVVNVNVASGAKVLGGTYTVNNMAAKLADGFTDDTTGKFYNHGTISGVTINGDLVSDGTLSDEKNQITVNGAANVNGSTVYTAKELGVNESTTILKATSITGTLANSESNPAKISGLLGGYGSISGNNVNYKISFVDNFGNLDGEQTRGLNILQNMSTALNGDTRKSELNPLYDLNDTNAKLALSQIGNRDATQMMILAQQNSYVGKILSDRLTTAFSQRTAEFSVGGNNFADGDDTILMSVNSNYNESVDYDIWVKFSKNWGKLREGANYHEQGISGGFDKSVGGNWRAGLFVSYDTSSLATDNFSGNIYGTRGGIYTGYHNSVDDVMLYLDFGKLRNKMSRSISALGLSTEAKFNSSVLEIGGEYKRNLTPDKTFGISPFVNVRYSHLRQHEYDETGAGIFNQSAQFESNSYVAGQLGFEFKRVLSNGNYALRLGANQALKVADPNFKVRYAGDLNNMYVLGSTIDRTHFIMRLGGENEFSSGWIFGGDVGWQRSKHDKDLSASVMLRKVW